MGDQPAPPCPNCQSARVLPIIWGHPPPEGFPDVPHVMGGCLVHGDERDPAWECLDCEHRFGEYDWSEKDA